MQHVVSNAAMTRLIVVPLLPIANISITIARPGAYGQLVRLETKKAQSSLMCSSPLADRVVRQLECETELARAKGANQELPGHTYCEPAP
jgi:hypothetical protein